MALATPTSNNALSARRRAGEGGALQGRVHHRRSHAAQALVDLLDVRPGALVLAVGCQPALKGQVLVEALGLGLDQPVHGLLGDAGGERGVHWAK